MSPMKSWVPIRLCELKQGFKDYCHLLVPSELSAVNLHCFEVEMQVSSVKASEREVLNMRNEANSVVTETRQTIIIEAFSASWNQLLVGFEKLYVL